MADEVVPEADERIASIISQWAPRGRTGLLPCLQEVQAVTGWLSPEVCRQVAEGLKVPLADVYGLVTFYSLLYEHPVGQTVIRVCDDVPCYLKGSQDVLRALEEHLGIRAGETSADGRVTLEVHPCLGRCERAPFVMVNDEEFGPVTPDEVASLLPDT